MLSMKSIHYIIFFIFKKNMLFFKIIPTYLNKLLKYCISIQYESHPLLLHLVNNLFYYILIIYIYIYIYYII